MNINEITIDSFVTLDVVTVALPASVAQAVAAMATRSVGAVLITRAEELVGIFTQGDLTHQAQRFGARVFDLPIEDLMTADPICVASGDTYSSAFTTMKESQIRRVPVLKNGKLMGILAIRDLIHFYDNLIETQYLEAKRESEELRDLVKSKVSEITDALLEEVERYRRLSLTDSLTGVYNKRYFDLRFKEEVERAKRYDEKLSIIFCDIDNFKRINDTGCDCGNR